MTQELISVIIPTFNRYDYVSRAINSVLNQTWKNLEVIVIDDCSTQAEYLGLQKNFEKDGRVIVIRLNKNLREVHGTRSAQGMTRNEGIKIAKGEWIAFLDDDDFYVVADKIETQIDTLKQLGDSYKFSCTNMLTGNGIDIDSYNKPYFLDRIGVPINNQSSVITPDILSYCNYVNNSTVLVHASIVKLVGLQELVVSEDYEYWKKCVKYTNIVYLHVPTVGYDMGHAYGKNYKYVASQNSNACEKVIETVV